MANQVESLKSRRFHHTKDAVDGSSGGGITFSLMQYNVLGDEAIPRGAEGANRCGKYEYCPASHRYMDSRHKRIMAEVGELNPDIVTMEEVSSNYFEHSLQPDMSLLGYDCLSHLRWDWLGLILFYKRDKFNPVSSESFLIYSRVEQLLSRAGISEKITEGLRQHMIDIGSEKNLLDPPGCLLAKLRLKEGNESVICIALTHLSWTKLKYPVLQLLEGSTVIEEMRKYSDGAACIVTGDFNTQPDMPLYQMMTDGQASANTMNRFHTAKRYIDHKMKVHGQDVLDVISGLDLLVKLKSSYMAVMGCEPETTNIDESLVFENQQGLYSGCLDYIWYTPDSLLPISVLDVPSTEELCKNTGLPSVVFPSDHLPIYAKLRLLE